MIQMPANELDIGCKSAEPVLIQGIIDAYFYEKNEAGEDEIVRRGLQDGLCPGWPGASGKI